MKNEAEKWFRDLRGRLVSMIEKYESAKFQKKEWNHSGRGGGLMSIIKGDLIEKGGVNISTVSGKFSEKMQKLISRFISISVLGFAFFGMLIGGCRLVYITTKLEQYSPSLKIPLAVIYSIVPISGLLIIFYKLTQSRK